MKKVLIDLDVLKDSFEYLTETEIADFSVWCENYKNSIISYNALIAKMNKSTHSIWTTFYLIAEVLEDAVISALWLVEQRDKALKEIERIEFETLNAKKGN